MAFLLLPVPLFLTLSLLSAVPAAGADASLSAPQGAPPAGSRTTAPLEGEDGGISVTWESAGLHPGAAVPVVVQAENLAGGTVSAGGEDFPLLPIRDGRYLALLGIDLAYGRDIFPIDIDLDLGEAGRAMVHRELPLATILRGEQKLTLPNEMVEFPPEAARRIEKEREAMEEAMAARSPAAALRPFLWPVTGRVSGDFGTRRILNGEARSPHSGVDVAAPLGRKVLAAGDGKVALAGNFYLSGKTVVVDHGWGVFTLYAHLNKIKVNSGDTIPRGAVVGTVGATGRATGPHLHYAAVIRGARVDPESLSSLEPLLE